MAQQRNLRNPPIVEAIASISVRFTSPPKPENFAELAKDLVPAFQGPENRHMWQIVIGDVQGQPGVVPAVAPSAVINNYVFRSVDGLSAIQSKTDGFTFSALPPYRGWPDLMTNALQFWEKYRDRYRPDRVVRCSVRFLNRLMLPGSMVDFDDYIVGGPKIPPELPQGLSEFRQSYVVPLPTSGAIARVQLAFSANDVTTSHVPVLFDLDILQECDLDPMDIGTIKTVFDSLRTLKNHVFFGTLTEMAVKEFE
jgi:uncharacterized protein (TIGR04255 family)